MTRKVLAGLAVATAALIAPATALASTPYAYHTVHARSAVASFNVTRDHYVITVWVYTTSGRYSLKPGAAPQIGTSSFTDVEIVVQDLDQPNGKGYLEVADWQGQLATPARFRGAMAGASLSATLLLWDWHSGETRVAAVNVVWKANGPSETRPSHMHARYPWLVTIISNSNDNERPAIATGTVVFGGATLVANGTDSGALLHSVKFNCRQIGYRQSIDFGECSAFNG